MFSMKCIISLLVLITSLYVVFSDKYGRENRKWAYAVIGYLLGYWLNA